MAEVRSTVSRSSQVVAQVRGRAVLASLVTSGSGAPDWVRGIYEGTSPPDVSTYVTLAEYLATRTGWWAWFNSDTGFLISLVSGVEAVSASASVTAGVPTVELINAEPVLFTAQGANLARALNLRATAGAQSYWPAPFDTFLPLVYVKDLEYLATTVLVEAFGWSLCYQQYITDPDYYTPEQIRTVVDEFMGMVGDYSGGQPSPPAWWALQPPDGRLEVGVGGDGDSALGFLWHANWYSGALDPVLTNAAWIARAIAFLDIYRDDDTVYSTHVAAIKAAMDAVPRHASGCLDAGAHGVEITDVTWEDAIGLPGAVAFGSAIMALAYKDMAIAAANNGDSTNAAAFTASKEALITGLATLRLPSGLYAASTGDDVPHVMASAVIAAEGLAPPVDIVETATALRDAYLTTSRDAFFRGYVRHVLRPDNFQYYPGGGGNDPYYGENGAYWGGEWVNFAARAISVIDTARASALIRDAIRENARQHLIDGGAPREVIRHPDDPAGYLLGNPAATAVPKFHGVADDEPDYFDIVLDSGNGYDVEVEREVGHQTVRVEVIPSGTYTGTVTVYGTPYVYSIDDEDGDPPTAGTEQEMCAISFSGTSAPKEHTTGALFPRAVFGGWVRAAATNGSGTITVRMHRTTTRLTLAQAPSAALGFNHFTGGDLSAYTIVGESGAWSIDAAAPGWLEYDHPQGFGSLFAPDTSTDVNFGVRFEVHDSSWSNYYMPILEFRHNLVDTALEIVIRTWAGQIQIVKHPGGTVLQSIGIPIPTPGTVIDISGRLVGQQFDIYVNNRKVWSSTPAQHTLPSNSGRVGFSVVRSGSPSTPVRIDSWRWTKDLTQLQPIPPTYVVDWRFGADAYDWDTTGVGCSNLGAVDADHHHVGIASASTLRNHLGAVVLTATGPEQFPNY